LKTASLTAAVAATLQPIGADAGEPANRKPVANWYIRSSPAETNGVGCLKTVIEKPPAPREGRLQADVYKRPPSLDIEALSDSELAGCGLPPKNFPIGTKKDSAAYRAWLADARAVMTDGDGPPWIPAALPPGTPPLPPPQNTTFPLLHHHPTTKSPPALHSERFDRYDSGAPANYGLGWSENYAGREIVDNYFDGGEQA
jgi:hypothetical protein